MSGAENALDFEHASKKQRAEADGKTVGATESETRDAIGRIHPRWGKNILSVLWTEAQIRETVAKMAKEISEYYNTVAPGEVILCVGLLKGAFLFVSDLLRQLTIPYEVEFMVVSSYGSGTKSGVLKLKKDVGIDPAGRHVLLLEDLIDTGTTLLWIQHHLATKKIKTVKMACFLNKTERRRVHVDVDWVGHLCPDQFVVGYGMDFNEEYRCLPFIGVLTPQVACTVLGRTRPKRTRTDHTRTHKKHRQNETTQPTCVFCLFTLARSGLQTTNNKNKKTNNCTTTKRYNGWVNGGV